MIDHREPRIDAYINKAAPYAQPILRHLRELLNAACPEVEETLKWGCPHYLYRGKILCATAAFKQHCSLHFWRYKEVLGLPASGGARGEGMGQFGKLTSLKDLPAKRTLIAHIKQAMLLNEGTGIRARPKSGPKPPPTTPADLAVALARRQHAKALRTWDGFTDGKRREYVAWLNEARTDATRGKRLATTLEWLAEGKPRNWKYMS